MMVIRPAILVAVFCSLLPWTAAAGVDLTPDEIKALSAGELVVKPLPTSGENSVIAGASFILVNNSPEIVWRALEDISAWTTLFPNTHEARLMAITESGQSVKMRFGNRLLELSFYLTVTFDKEKKEAFYALNKSKPHDIQETRGSVRMSPQPGGRTLVIFSSLVHVPFTQLISLLGADIIERIERKVLSVPMRLKKWVEGEHGAKYKSP